MQSAIRASTMLRRYSPISQTITYAVNASSSEDIVMFRVTVWVVYRRVVLNSQSMHPNPTS
jgi:hypothetical protein